MPFTRDDFSGKLAGDLELTGGGSIITTANGDLQLLPNGSGITKVGDAGTTSHSLAANDDLFVAGKFEADGLGYFDAAIACAGQVSFTKTSGNYAALSQGNIRIYDDKYLQLGTDGDSIVGYNTTQTPDTLLLSLPATSLGLVICGRGDEVYDFAHAIQTNPTIWIQSATQSATEWGSLAHDQTDFVISSGAGDVKLAPAVGVISVLPAAGKFYINGTSTAHTDTNGVLDVDVTAGATGVVGLDLSLTSPTAGLGAGETIYGISVGVNGDGDDNATSNRIAVQVGYTPNAAGGTTYGFYNNDGDFTWGVYNAAETYLGDNVGIMASSFGTNADGTLALGNSTAPTTSPANMVQLYAGDEVAGQSSLYLRTEDDGVTSWNNRAGTTHRWCTQEEVADSGKITTQPGSSNGGFGFATCGDGEEYALFSFTSAGVVTLISNSANVSTTEDQDTDFNIYDAGATVGYNNELGGAKNVTVMVWYS
jgi:hypothetical protein